MFLNIKKSPATVLLSKLSLALAAATVVTSSQGVMAAPVPEVGEWDGVTASAKLDGPYEDIRQSGKGGFLSYYTQPWRAYMDTWPADRFLESMGVNFNIGAKNAEAVAQILSESGIRQARIEFGWGDFDYHTEKLEGAKRKNAIEILQLFQKKGIRPLLLLNSHHAAPCPFRNITVEFVADAKKGDTTFKVKDGTAIRVGYTGPMYTPEYSAAKPLITKVDADGTCHLSAGLGDDLKAGPQPLWELKYRPFHGFNEKNATPEENAMWKASAYATFDGWMKYIEETAEMAVEALGTKGKPDAGFDMEVWNELTFGSNFLDLNNYYEKKWEFTELISHTRTRPVQADFRPDAVTDFKREGILAIFARTLDYMNEHAKEYPGVKVDNGFDNQWTFDSGAESWPNQGAISRHFYLGGWWEISPKTARPDMGTLDALGNLDGVKGPRDWYDIEPGTNYIPTLRAGMPEWGYSNFQFEKIITDVMPDSRLSGGVHGRYTHNGDFHQVELWQTEFNYGRAALMEEIFKQTKADRDDPKMLALDDRLGGKFALRSYLFQNHKGLARLYMFAPGDPPYNIGMFSPLFFKALEKSDGKLTPEVRALVPSFYKGLAWLTKQMEASTPLAAPRPLRVDALTEYKPRLMIPGKGTPQHPHRYNRDHFAILPYQVTASKFLIPYYVVTVDASHIWQPEKDPFDPSRYDMPEQDFDVTIGNVAGANAKVSAYDPLTNTSVPVAVLKSTPCTLTVKLKTVDYPRILVVEEQKIGPQILDPKVSTDKDGVLSLSWKTNIPVNAVKVTYGKDWQNRAANELTVPGGKQEYSLKIPTGQKGVLAARIKVAANGLSNVWPRWDEDPRGQVVVPGSTRADVSPMIVSTPTGPTAQVGDFIAPEGVTLPVVEPNVTRRYSLKLPQGTTFSGAPDDREATIGTGANAIRIRAHYTTESGRNSEALLPFAAVGDIANRRLVKLPSGVSATFVDFIFRAEQHPGVVNLHQKYLLIPVEKTNDVLVLSAQGTPAAMQAQDKLITAIFASVLTTP